MSEKEIEFGFLTLATKNDYLKAIGLALSIRVSNPGVPIAIACSNKVRPLVEPYFDYVIEEQAGLRGFIHKVYLDIYSPFQNTVFFPYVGMRIYPGTRLQELAIKEGIILPEDDLLEPAYYLAKGINYLTLKKRAIKTGRRFVFPDEDVVTVMNRMRDRQRKGMLWHHLRT